MDEQTQNTVFGLLHSRQGARPSNRSGRNQSPLTAWGRLALERLIQPLLRSTPQHPIE